MVYHLDLVAAAVTTVGTAAAAVAVVVMIAEIVVDYVVVMIVAEIGVVVVVAVIHPDHVLFVHHGHDVAMMLYMDFLFVDLSMVVVLYDHLFDFLYIIRIMFFKSIQKQTKNLQTIILQYF